MSKTFYVSDDEWLTEILLENGWQVEMAPWSLSETDWRQYAAVIIRTPWDYTERPLEFLGTLDAIEAAGVPLMNPAKYCRWNYDKRYLLELAGKGVEIVPTVLIQPPLDLEKLEKAAAEIGLAEGWILKPIIGATASGVFKMQDWRDISAEALAAYSAKPVFLQPFIPSIQTEGEYSLHFFNGNFSHAILKVPAQGDFRVQEEWGGVPHGISPEAGLMQAAQQVMDTLPKGLLYARIDLVRLPNGQFGLMEAEIIEPALYFRTDPDSPRRFVEAFLQKMGELETSVQE